MNLPSFGITWNHYRNTTPTFDLTSVEKPDLSPFLIHMTGKDSLVIYEAIIFQRDLN
jgi:hypothetical protein